MAERRAPAPRSPRRLLQAPMHILAVMRSDIIGHQVRATELDELHLERRQAQPFHPSTLMIEAMTTVRFTTARDRTTERLLPCPGPNRRYPKRLSLAGLEPSNCPGRPALAPHLSLLRARGRQMLLSLLGTSFPRSVSPIMALRITFRVYVTSPEADRAEGLCGGAARRSAAKPEPTEGRRCTYTLLCEVPVSTMAHQHQEQPVSRIANRFHPHLRYKVPQDDRVCHNHLRARPPAIGLPLLAKR